MKWLIRVLILISLFVYSDIDGAYIGKSYYVEYPCVIMEVPGYVKYILHSPGGNITATYETRRKHHE